MVSFLYINSSDCDKHVVVCGMVQYCKNILLVYVSISSFFYFIGIYSFKESLKNCTAHSV